MGLAGVALGTTSLDHPETTGSTRPICIHHGGRRFVASAQMAEIFVRRAQRLIDDGEAQLVPLLHLDGLELLLITATTPLSAHFTAEK
jgi:hypothetical protein